MGAEKCSLGEETVRIAENSIGIVVIRQATEKFGKAKFCFGKAKELS